MAWSKSEKYYLKADTESPAYYAAIILHLQVKDTSFEITWHSHPEKRDDIEAALANIKAYWNECYPAQILHHLPSTSSSEPSPVPALQAPLIYTSAQDHKHFK
jgi:hypothetical protein